MQEFIAAVKENLDTERSIRTFKGIYFDVFEPDYRLIDIEDIAHSLAMQCRFNGHIKEFYSVAQHSVWVAERVPQIHMKAALLHDASEAYLADIPSPIKKHFTQYHVIEDLVMRAVAKRFDFEYPFADVIKEYDRKALVYEWNYKVIENIDTDNWDFKLAKAKFIECFNRIESNAIVPR